MKRVAVIDYDMGNLHSVCKGLEFAGVEPRVTDQAQDILDAAAVVLPGVGAFDPAMAHLHKRNLGELLPQVIAQGKPFLGICLGLQILFERSEEGQTPGLGLLAGTVNRFQTEPDLTIPHMGWNQLHLSQPELPLWQGLEADPWLYFVHSFYVAPTDPSLIAATVTHGHQTVTAAIAKDNLMAVQFHPEKSATTGLKILKNFANLF